MVTRFPGAAPSTAVLADAAGQAADAADEETVVLRDGSAVVIQPLADGDLTAIIAWFDGLGPETRYARFLASVDRLDDKTLSWLAHVDHREHEALTAVAPDGTTVGIARYIRMPQPETAEVAVAVADRWCGLGIASLLLQRIAASARAADIRWLTAQCLISNAAMVRLLRRLGPTSIGPPVAGVAEVRTDLGRGSATAAAAGRAACPAVDPPEHRVYRAVLRAANQTSGEQ